MSPEERRMCPTGVFLLRTVCVSWAWIWFTLCRCSAVKPCFFLPTWNTENSPRRQPYWQFVALKHRKTSPWAVLPSGSMSLTLLLQQKLLCQMLFVTTQFTWTWLWKPAHRTGCSLEKTNEPKVSLASPAAAQHMAQASKASWSSPVPPVSDKGQKWTFQIHVSALGCFLVSVNDLFPMYVFGVTALASPGWVLVSLWLCWAAVLPDRDSATMLAQQGLLAQL